MPRGSPEELRPSRRGRATPLPDWRQIRQSAVHPTAQPQQAAAGAGGARGVATPAPPTALFVATPLRAGAAGVTGAQKGAGAATAEKEEARYRTSEGEAEGCLDGADEPVGFLSSCVLVERAGSGDEGGWGGVSSLLMRWDCWRLAIVFCELEGDAGCEVEGESSPTDTAEADRRAPAVHPPGSADPASPPPAGIARFVDAIGLECITSISRAASRPPSDPPALVLAIATGEPPSGRVWSLLGQGGAPPAVTLSLPRLDGESRQQAERRRDRLVYVLRCLRLRLPPATRQLQIPPGGPWLRVEAELAARPMLSTADAHKLLGRRLPLPTHTLLEPVEEVGARVGVGVSVLGVCMIGGGRWR